MANNKQHINLVALLIVAGGLFASADAQVYRKLGTAGMKFLAIDASVRSAAMGGASNSMFDGAEALFRNPAGLAQVDGVGLYIGNNRWIADINQIGVAVAINLNRVGLGWLGGTLGASFRSTDNGDMVRTDFSQVTEDNQYYVYNDPYTIEEWAVGLAYAKQLTNSFSFGAHVKYAVQDLGELDIYRAIERDTVRTANRLHPLILDFGTIYFTGFRDLRISMSFRNFSQELIYVRDKFELPITMVIGTAVTVWGEPGKSHSVLMNLDASHPRDYDERINLGIEYLYGPLALRTGYRFNHDEEGLSTGMGLDLTLGESSMAVDYAYTMFGVFGAVQRASIGFDF